MQNRYTKDNKMCKRNKTKEGIRTIKYVNNKIIDGAVTFCVK